MHVKQGPGALTGVPWRVQGATDPIVDPVLVKLAEYQRAAFGGVLVAQDTPIVALTFDYNVNTYFVETETANGGTVTTANSHAALQTSANAAGMAHLHSKAAVRYTPGQGIIARFTACFISGGWANSQQEIGIGDTVDGFFFGYQGATFGVFRRQDSVDTFVAQTAWNVDRMDGSAGALNPSGQLLDQTKGNVYVIQYQWLGFGAIRFFVENATTGELQLVHIIRYANANVHPSIFNPTLPLHAKVVNTGNTVPLILETSSLGAYIEGPESKIGAIGSAGNQKTPVTETNIISIRNNATFQSKTNRTRVKLKFLNSLTAADTIIRVLLNTTLGGAPSFTDFDTNTSPVSFDVAGTTVTGGRQLLRFASAKATLNMFDMDPLEIRLNPGDVATFTAVAGATDINVAWFEEFGG